LREAGLLAQGGELQGHIPRLTGLLETRGKGWVLHLLGQLAIKIRLFHVVCLFCQ
jgi:hypothetical protein